jgi:hypothetical protein
MLTVFRFSNLIDTVNCGILAYDYDLNGEGISAVTP